MMEEYKLFRELRHKQDKTQVEELLLKYRKTITTISEILVDESKMHISSEKTLKKIHNVINDNI